MIGSNIKLHQLQDMSTGLSCTAHAANITAVSCRRAHQVTGTTSSHQASLKLQEAFKVIKLPSAKPQVSASRLCVPLCPYQASPISLHSAWPIQFRSTADSQGRAC